MNGIQIKKWVRWEEKEEYSLQLLAAPSQYLHLNQRENKKGTKMKKIGGEK